jgi:hypothetical protein
MNFTTAGLVRVRTRGFLQDLQQLPQNYVAIVFLAIAACSDDDGELVFLSDDEVLDFIHTHRQQLADMMMDAQAAIIALQNGTSDVSYYNKVTKNLTKWH